MLAYSIEGLSGSAVLLLAVVFGIGAVTALWCVLRVLVAYHKELWRERRERPQRSFWLASIDAMGIAASRHLNLTLAFIGIWWALLLGMIVLTVLYGEPVPNEGAM